MTIAVDAPVLHADLQLDSRWNRIPGITVSDGHIAIDVAEYFFRYEQPLWTVVPWETVQGQWDSLTETPDCSLEQRCLDFIKEHSHTTSDPAEVLSIAERVYAKLYDESHLEDPGLAFATPSHFQVLREMSIMMALNNVSRDGVARNVGPAWFFPVCAQVVFDLDEPDAQTVDELYHGGFFNEERRVESIKAHTALGGRLVHGCQSVPDMAGGAIVPYGTDTKVFQENLRSFKAEWMATILSWR